MSGSDEDTSNYSSPYDSDLAYGGSSSDDSLDDAPYEGLTDQTYFAADTLGQTMQRLHHDIIGIEGDFQQIREMAGLTTVRFGPAAGGGAGVTHFGENGQEIVLDPNHPEVLEGGSMRLLGTATFEFINAAAAQLRADLDYRTGGSSFHQEAAARQMSPAQYYGMELERIEFNNALAHRTMVHELGRAGTHMDIFQDTVPRLRQSDRGGERYEQEFRTYYERQYTSGHTQSYEGHYPQALYEAQAARRARAASASHGKSSGKTHKHDKGGGGHGHGHKSSRTSGKSRK